MRHPIAELFAAGLVLALASPVAAAPGEAAPACARIDDSALPVAFAGWRAPTPRAAAARADAAGAIAPGDAVALRLLPAEAVTLAAPPARNKPAAAPYAGLIGIEIARVGRYRVALSTPGWIEIVTGGGAVAFTAHGHGPACASIRKIVDFALPAGRHLVQITSNPGADAKLMIVAD